MLLIFITYIKVAFYIIKSFIILSYVSILVTVPLSILLVFLIIYLYCVFNNTEFKLTPITKTIIYMKLSVVCIVFVLSIEEVAISYIPTVVQYIIPIMSLVAVNDSTTLFMNNPQGGAGNPTGNPPAGNPPAGNPPAGNPPAQPHPIILGPHWLPLNGLNTVFIYTGTHIQIIDPSGQNTNRRHDPTVQISKEYAKNIYRVLEEYTADRSHGLSIPLNLEPGQAQFIRDLRIMHFQSIEATGRTFNTNRHYFNTRAFRNWLNDPRNHS
jgi:hypothetical protein